MMNVFFRVDSSSRIGTGHIMRCLTLANELNTRGVDVFFICRELEGNISGSVEEKGFKVYRLPYCPDVSLKVDLEQTCAVLKNENKDISWLVVDHYALDKEWECRMKPYVKKIMVIDELADRQHDCDLLLDQSFVENMNNYSELLPPDCRGLYGTQYLLLRPEFSVNWGRADIDRSDMNDQVVHVFFGGCDINGHTGRFSRLLAENFTELRLNIIVGGGYKYTDELKELVGRFKDRLNWLQDVPDMSDSMRTSNIAFGAPGITTWERACVGLASAYCAINENQIKVLEFLDDKGLCSYIGYVNTVSDDEFISKFDRFLNDRQRLTSMRNIGLTNVDGCGAKRVSSIMLE